MYKFKEQNNFEPLLHAKLLEDDFKATLQVQYFSL